MRVGFYLNTDHLESWDWENVLQGRIALSGTDGQTLLLADALARMASVEVLLFTTLPGTTPSATPLSQIEVDCFAEAVHQAAPVEVLVFNNEERPDLIEGVHAADKRSQKCIAWCHNGPWHRMASLYTYADAVRRVICVSHRHADLYREKPVFDKIGVIPNSLDVDWYRPDSSGSPNAKTVCYVGALTPAKGFHHLARAWPQVRASVPEARLVVVGSARLYERNIDLGPLNIAHPRYEQNEIIPHLGGSREHAREYGVEFRGLLPPRDLRGVLHSSSIGVVNPNTDPSGSLETFCVTAVEMQAAETAVVGGRRRGLRETVQDQKTGVLIDSPDQLAPALRHLLTNPDTARGMGRRGRQWVSRRYDRPRIVARWKQILEATAQEKPPEPPSFCLRRATTKTVFREGIRRLHALAGSGRISVLDRILGWRQGFE